MSAGFFSFFLFFQIGLAHWLKSFWLPGLGQLLIQLANLATLTYTPGMLVCAQSTPHVTRPTTYLELKKSFRYGEN